MYITLVVLGTPLRGNQLSVLTLRWLFRGDFLAAVTCAEIFGADYGSSISSLLPSPNNRLLSYVLAFFILVSLATGVRSEFPSPSFLYWSLLVPCRSAVWFTIFYLLRRSYLELISITSLKISRAGYEGGHGFIHIFWSLLFAVLVMSSFSTSCIGAGSALVVFFTSSMVLIPLFF